tara:strand:+ start:2739 stop:3548 length:810 start_codon:yes stop_codon:yes gene_type:complete
MLAVLVEFPALVVKLDPKDLPVRPELPAPLVPPDLKATPDLPVLTPKSPDLLATPDLLDRKDLKELKESPALKDPTDLVDPKVTPAPKVVKASKASKALTVPTVRRASKDLPDLKDLPEMTEKTPSSLDPKDLKDLKDPPVPLAPMVPSTSSQTLIPQPSPLSPDKLWSGTVDSGNQATSPQAVGETSPLARCHTSTTPASFPSQAVSCRCLVPSVPPRPQVRPSTSLGFKSVVAGLCPKTDCIESPVTFVSDLQEPLGQPSTSPSPLR